jgi:transposase-like protein
MPTGDRRTTEIARAAAMAFPDVSAKTIAEALGMDPKTVRRHRAKKRPSTRWRELPVAKIAAAYDEGASIGSLASEYGVSPQTIRRRLEKADVTMRDEAPTAKLDLPMAEIAGRYLAGRSAAFLADEYGCSETTIKRRLRDECGITLRPPHRPKSG